MLKIIKNYDSTPKEPGFILALNLIYHDVNNKSVITNLKMKQAIEFERSMNKSNFKYLTLFFKLINILFILFYLIGCASIDTKPLTKFNTVTNQLTNDGNVLLSLKEKYDSSMLALFSTIASSAAQDYISNKRKKHLIAIINSMRL